MKRVISVLSFVHCQQRGASQSSRPKVVEKVFPLQWVILPVPTPYPSDLFAKSKDESLLFLDVLPNRARFRVPLNGAPTEFDS
jgi:hypothetical protein